MTSQQLFDTLNRTYFGKIVRGNKVDDAILILGHDREFFRITEMSYSNPDFRAIREAVTTYKEFIK